MPKKVCKKKGGTEAEAVRAIFRCVVPNRCGTIYYTYTCDICGKTHITTSPKIDK